MKLTLKRTVAFLLLIALSVGFGFGFDAVANAVERHQHPRPAEIADLIESNARQFGLPEPVLWAIIRTESNFISNAVSNTGAIGLMQLTPTEFSYICTQILGEDAKDSGMLYDPATNLRCGAAWISFLYQRYGVWDTVYAACYVGTDTVDTWLTNSELVTPQGILRIPDKSTADYVGTVNRAVRLYSRLYYES